MISQNIIVVKAKKMAGVTAGGLFLSTVLGLMSRRLQVSIIGKEQPRSLNRITGYALSVGAFVGGYVILGRIVDHNGALLERRLAILREQRAQKEAFMEFEKEPDHRLTADKRASGLKLLDEYSAPYK